MHVPAFLHVENVARVDPTTEVEEAEEVYPEVQQPQEFEVAEEDQVTTTDLANPDLQQGKHQSISTQCLTYFKFMQLLIPVHLS